MEYLVQGWSSLCGGDRGKNEKKITIKEIKDVEKVDFNPIYFLHKKVMQQEETEKKQSFKNCRKFFDEISKLTKQEIIYKKREKNNTI